MSASSVGSFVAPAAAACAQERLGDRTETQEGDLGGRPGTERPGGLLRRTTIVLVGEAHLAGSHERVPGDLGAGVADDQ